MNDSELLCQLKKGELDVIHMAEIEPKVRFHREKLVYYVDCWKMLEKIVYTF